MKLPKECEAFEDPPTKCCGSTECECQHEPPRRVGNISVGFVVLAPQNFIIQCFFTVVKDILMLPQIVGDCKFSAILIHAILSLPYPILGQYHLKILVTFY